MFELHFRLFYVHLRQDEHNHDVQDQRQPQIHEMQHVNTGIWLDGKQSRETADFQHPAGNSRTKAAAELSAKGRTRIHRPVHSLAFCQEGVF